MAVIDYTLFDKKLRDRIKEDDEAYYDLLKKVIDNPDRYTGIFRLTNAKTKLIQNVTQSHEIKFGDFMEDIVTDYIEKMGYTNLDKSIGKDKEGNELSADQVFTKNNTVYLIEQKIRDDHDSTKKRGQFDNFRKKYTLLKEKHVDKNIIAIMWFIDDGLVKNKNYYLNEATKEKSDNITLYVLYGGTLFETIFNRIDIWEEIVNYLQKNKSTRSSELLVIPDFDTSPEILKALKRLKKEEPKKYVKLISNNPKYIQLRKELFPTESNIKKA